MYDLREITSLQVLDILNGLPCHTLILTCLLLTVQQLMVIRDLLDLSAILGSIFITDSIPRAMLKNLTRLVDYGVVKEILLATVNTDNIYIRIILYEPVYLSIESPRAFISGTEVNGNGAVEEELSFSKTLIFGQIISEKALGFLI